MRSIAIRRYWLSFSAMQPERLLEDRLIAEVFNFNALPCHNRVAQTLPVLQPGLYRIRVVITCQQQNAVDIAGQARKLIAIPIAQRLPESRFQLRRMARQVNIGKAFERIGHFRLRFGVEERLPGFGDQPFGQRQFSHRRLRAIDSRDG